MICPKCKKYPAKAWLNGNFICLNCFDKAKWELDLLRRQRKAEEKKLRKGKESSLM